MGDLPELLMSPLISSMHFFQAYQFDFYVVHRSASPGDIPKHVGIAYILPVNLRETKGLKTIPINGLKHLPIGQFTGRFLP